MLADFVGRGGTRQEGGKSHFFIFKLESLENIFKIDRKDSVEREFTC